MRYNEHPPAHFHAEYAEHSAAYDLDGNRINGEMPVKQDRLIAAWAIMRKDELEECWKLALSQTEMPSIEPLR